MEQTQVSLGERVASIAARIERLPFTGTQIRARVIIGTATFFDAFDAITIAYVLPVLTPLWNLTSQQIGALISVGYLGQLVGALFFGWLAERYGRLRSLQLSIIILSLFSLACAVAPSYWWLFLFRTIQGLGLGGEVPVAAAYINEISKARRRGLFFLAYELTFALGLLVTAFLGRLIVPSLGWRWMFVIGAIPAILVIFLRRTLPESPRWLALQGRVDEAERVVMDLEREAERVRGTLPEPVVRPEYYVTRFEIRFSELFSPLYRRRTLVLWVMWFASYFANYGIQTWAPTIYRTVYNIPVQQALNYALYAQMLAFVGSVLCTLFIDVTGRRAWFIGAYSLGGIILLLLASLGAGDATQVVILLSISLFFFSNTSLALYVYTPEQYPTRLRALGTSVATSWLRLASAIGPYVMGVVVPVIGIAGAFAMFGAVLLLGGLVVALFGIETKEQPLEVLAP